MDSLSPEQPMIHERFHAVHVRRVQTAEGFRSLQETWNAVLAESPADSFFLRWEWLYAWWTAYREDNHELCILLVFRGDRLIGIGPFYVIKHVWRTVFRSRRLMFLGTKEGSVISEYLDVICKDGEEKAVLRGIAEYIVEEDLCDDMRLQKIEASSKTLAILRHIAGEMQFLHVIQEKADSPYIKLPTRYADFLDNLSSSLRYKIKNERKKLEQNRSVVFRKTEDSLALETDFQELVRLHQHRWESRHLLGSFSEEKFVLLHKTVMPSMLDNGNLELWFLSVEEKNIAALYNIRYKNKIYFYQGGLDDSFDKRLAPGLLLHSHCIEEAIREGLHEYDFLLMGNRDSYKKRWTRDTRYLCDIYLARPGIIKLAMAAKNKVRVLYHSFKEAVC